MGLCFASPLPTASENGRLFVHEKRGFFRKRNLSSKTVICDELRRAGVAVADSDSHLCPGRRGAVRGGDAEAHAAVLPRQSAVLRGVPDHRAGAKGELELPPEAGVRGRHTEFRYGARVRAAKQGLPRVKLKAGLKAK